MRGFKKSLSLTSTKAPTDKRSLAITTPTEGIIRVNSIACEAMGIDYSTLRTTGQFVDVIKGQKRNGEPILALIVTDGEVGSKLGSPNNRGAGNLQFSSKAAWLAMSGATDSVTKFSVAPATVDTTDDGEDITLADAIANGDIDEATMTWTEDGVATDEGVEVYYPLVLISTVAKVERNYADKDEVEVEPADAADGSDVEYSDEDFNDDELI